MAQEQEAFTVIRDWLTNNDAVTYLWALGTTFWGAVVSYFDKDEPFAWRRFFAHFSGCAFAGMLVYLLCQATSIEGPMVGVLCGIASHMGTPAIIKLLKKNKSVAAFFGDDTTTEKKDA